MKKFLAVLLTVLMIAGMLPVMSFAAAPSVEGIKWRVLTDGEVQVEVTFDQSMSLSAYDNSQWALCTAPTYTDNSDPTCLGNMPGGNTNLVSGDDKTIYFKFWPNTDLSALDNLYIIPKFSSSGSPAAAANPSDKMGMLTLPIPPQAVSVNITTDDKIAITFDRPISQSSIDAVDATFKRGDTNADIMSSTNSGGASFITLSNSDKTVTFARRGGNGTGITSDIRTLFADPDKQLRVYYEGGSPITGANGSHIVSSSGWANGDFGNVYFKPVTVDVAAADTSARLTNLEINAGGSNLLTGFDPDTLTYAVTVPHDATQVAIITAGEEGATVECAEDNDDGTASLTAGDESVTVLNFVTAAAVGSGTLTYVVTITKDAPPAPPAPVVKTGVISSSYVATGGKEGKLTLYLNGGIGLYDGVSRVVNNEIPIYAAADDIYVGAAKQDIGGGKVSVLTGDGGATLMMYVDPLDRSASAHHGVSPWDGTAANYLAPGLYYLDLERIIVSGSDTKWYMKNTGGTQIYDRFYFYVVGMRDEVPNITPAVDTAADAIALGDTAAGEATVSVKFDTPVNLTEIALNKIELYNSADAKMASTATGATLSADMKTVTFTFDLDESGFTTTDIADVPDTYYVKFNSGHNVNSLGGNKPAPLANYSFTVASLDDATLITLSVTPDGGTAIDVTLTDGIFAYTVDVPHDTTNITIDATAAGAAAGATVTGDGIGSSAAVTDGDEITLTVTSADGNETEDYVITINLLPAPVAPATLVDAKIMNDGKIVLTFSDKIAPVANTAIDFTLYAGASSEDFMKSFGADYIAFGADEKSIILSAKSGGVTQAVRDAFEGDPTMVLRLKNEAADLKDDNGEVIVAWNTIMSIVPTFEPAAGPALAIESLVLSTDGKIRITFNKAIDPASLTGLDIDFLLPGAPGDKPFYSTYNSAENPRFALENGDKTIVFTNAANKPGINSDGITEAIRTLYGEDATAQIRLLHQSGSRIKDTDGVILESGNATVSFAPVTVEGYVPSVPDDNNTLALLEVYDEATMATTPLTMDPTFTQAEGIVMKVTVPAGTASVWVKAEATDTAVTTVTISDEVSAGTGEVALTGITTSILVTVTPDNGSPKVYRVEVTRPASANNKLGTLTTDLTGDPVGAAFDPDVAVVCSTVVADTVDSFSFTALTTDDSAATFAVTNNNITVDHTGPITLGYGDNSIKIIVTAENGDKKTYMIDIERDEPAGGIIIPPGTPGFEVRASINAVDGDYMQFDVYVNSAIFSVGALSLKFDPAKFDPAGWEMDDFLTPMGIIDTSLVGDALFKEMPTFARGNCALLTTTYYPATSVLDFEFYGNAGAEGGEPINASGTPVRLFTFFMKPKSGITPSTDLDDMSMALTKSPNAAYSARLVALDALVDGNQEEFHIGGSAGFPPFASPVSYPGSFTIGTATKRTTAQLDNFGLPAGVDLIESSPDFATAVNTYTVTVGNDVDTLTINPTAIDGGVVSGDTTLALVPGDTDFFVKVKSEDGATNRIYTLRVTRAKSDLKTLSNVTLNGTTITNYTQTVPYATSKAVVTATATAPGTATVSPVGEITLTPGTPTDFTITITAEDGSTTTETVTVTRTPANTDKTLSVLTVNGIAVVGGAVTVLGNATSALVVATPAGLNATAVVTGSTTFTTPVGTEETLNLSVTVTSEDGVTQVYPIVVTRPAILDSSATITLSVGNKSKADLVVGNKTTSYYVVPAAAATCDFTVNAADATATISRYSSEALTGAAVASGTGTLTGTLPLAAGNTSYLYFKVTVGTGAAEVSNIYKVEITRPSSYTPPTLPPGGGVIDNGQTSHYQQMLTQIKTAYPELWDHWAGTAVADLIFRELLRGDQNGALHLADSITRAEFTAMMVRMLGIAPAYDNASFDDVSGGKWYAGEIAAAKNIGLAQAYPDGTFRPDQKVSRQEMIVLMKRALVIQGSAAGISVDTNAVLAQFGDNASVSGWARDDVAVMVALGCINGDGGNLKPGNSSTRAEAAQVVYKAIHLTFAGY